MIYQNEIKQMPLNGFLMGKSYLSDTAALSAEEFRQLTCMLDMFAKYGQEPEAYKSNSMMYRQLLEKYADKVYKKKLDNYIAEMKIDKTSSLMEISAPIPVNIWSNDIEDAIEAGDYDDDDVADWREERGLALNLADEFLDDISTAANISEYAEELMCFLEGYSDVFGANGIEDDDGDRRTADALHNLQLIIDHGNLIEDKKKRNEFLRTFDFDFR